MKKLTIITLCVTLLITLFTGCSSTPTSTGNGDNNTANSTESKTTEKQIPDLTGEWKQSNSKSDDTKTMTYQNGVLSYESSAMGTTTKVKLEKQK